LEKALGKPAGSIPPIPDIAFCFQSGSEGQGRCILRTMGCKMERPIIGMALNMRVFERLPGRGTANPYLQVAVKFINHCLDRHDVDVVLQANEIESQAFTADDRYLCSLVATAVSRPDRCFMTRETLSAEATKSLIGCFDFLVGSRFHSFVFAFSQGIPGLAVSWSHKYKELFALFGMEEYVLECREIDAEVLIVKFEKAWSECRKLKGSILKTADRLRSDVNALFDEAVMHIHGV
jgi:polysaccharide pyruvyl transferase WcaK-like protein